MPERITAYAQATGHDPEAYAAGQLREDARHAFRSLLPGTIDADVAGCVRWLLTGWHPEAGDRLAPKAVARALPGSIVANRPVEKSERAGGRKKTHGGTV